MAVYVLAQMLAASDVAAPDAADSSRGKSRSIPARHRLQDGISEGYTYTVDRVFRPEAAVPIPRGQQFKLVLDIEPTERNYNWQFLELADPVVATQRGVQVKGNTVEFSMTGARTEVGSGLVTVGYRSGLTWFTFPIAVSLYTPQRVDEELLLPNDGIDTVGIFFIIFLCLDGLILLAIGAHAFVHRQTWGMPMPFLDSKE